MTLEIVLRCGEFGVSDSFFYQYRNALENDWAEGGESSAQRKIRDSTDSESAGGSTSTSASARGDAGFRSGSDPNG